MNVALALALAGLIPVSAGTPADDGPCPPGTYWSIPKGADYHDDTWFTAEGQAFGFAEEEDECWTPVLMRGES